MWRKVVFNQLKLLVKILVDFIQLLTSILLDIRPYLPEEIYQGKLDQSGDRIFSSHLIIKLSHWKIILILEIKMENIKGRIREKLERKNGSNYCMN